MKILDYLNYNHFPNKKVSAVKKKSIRFSLKNYFILLKLLSSQIPINYTWNSQNFLMNVLSSHKNQQKPRTICHLVFELPQLPLFSQIVKILITKLQTKLANKFITELIKCSLKLHHRELFIIRQFNFCDSWNSRDFH